MDRQGAAPFALILTSLIVSLCPFGVKADGTGASTKIDAGSKLADPQDQVVVEARKEKLRELTQDVAKSEDAFFDAYNRINSIREFDVHCSVETLTGTHISKRECRPRFVDKAREEEASNILDTIMDTSGASGSATAPVRGMSANQMVNDKLRDYKKHLVEVVIKNEKLRKMLGEYGALKRRYDAALKE